MLGSTRTTAELFDCIRELGPLIKAHQQENDERGRIADPVMNAFFERDLFRVYLPHDLGGSGADLITGMRLTEEVAYFDGSTGWVYQIGSGAMLRAAFLPAEQARALFSRRDLFVAGTFPPQGRATPVEDGFRVSGRWGFASGIYHAGWVMTGCLVMDGDEPRTTREGAPVVVQVLVPKEQATVLDTWDVGGMRGTGSTSYTLEDVFVPGERTSLLSQREPSHPAPIFKVLDATTGVGFAFVGLGIARATIDGVIDLAMGQPAKHPDGSALRDRPSAQYAVAKAQAMLESARLYLEDALGELWATAERGEGPSFALRTRIRRAQAHAGETATEVVDEMYRTAGSAALFRQGPFERSLRDVHAVAAQVTLQRSAMEDVGRVAFGLEPRLRGF